MTPLLNNRASPPECGIDDRDLAAISAILDRKRSFRLMDYKNACMKRRIAMRMRATHCRDATEYCRLLLQRGEELDSLLKALTIHVSQFFRNPSLFEKLRNQVFPELFATAALRPDNTLRIWCMGCAAGEEPYSLAILLRECCGPELRRVKTVILGTDIDAGTLESASRGEYGVERLRDVSPLFRERYFRPHGKRFRLIPEIKDMVSFSRDNLAHVSRYLPCDIALCRNTLIYFNRAEQERILEGIADILPLNGILVLGKSETLVGKARRRFTPLCPVERIYRRVT